MKVRTGFVSNSSSSSFIIRGVKLKIADLAKRMGINPKTDDLWEELWGKVEGKGVTIESTRYYFDDHISMDTADVIVGKVLCSLDDGVVKALPDPNDTAVKQMIENKIGNIDKLKLKTYVQFVSNDNY